MNCKQVRRTFDPTTEAPSWLGEHVDGCPACQRYVGEVRHLHSLLRSVPSVPVPRDFDLRLQQRLERVRRSPLYWWRFLSPRVAFPIAAMALVAVGAFLMLNRSNEALRPGTEMSATVASSAAAVARASEPPRGAAPAPAPAVRPAAGEMDHTASLNLPPLARPESGHERGTLLGPASENTQVILRILDESNQRERLVAIPSMLFGAKPVFTTAQVSQKEVENVF